MSKRENWGDVERRAQAHELTSALGLQMVKITVEDRQRAAIIEAMGELEQGHATSAWQILQDALKVKEVV